MIVTIISLITALIIGSEEIRISFISDSSIVSYKGYHPAHSWEGVSRQVKGGLICTNTNFSDCIVKIIIPIESFDSGNSGRDSNMLFHVESNKFPFVKFSSNSFDMNKIINKKINLNGVLDFHGNNKDILTSVEIFVKDSLLYGEAKFSISLEAYNVKRPQLLFVPISDEIIIESKIYCDNIFIK